MHTIFYFSGTGNTWLMANRIYNRLVEEGQHCQIHSIETLNPEAIHNILAQSSHVIIGYPIYGSAAPKPMIDFINNLPTLETAKALSVFCTQAFYSGDGANYLESVFKEKNYTLLRTQEFNLSNNFYVPIFIRAFKVGSEEKIEKRKDHSFKRAENFISAIINDSIRVKKVSFINRKMGDFQRKELPKHIITLGKTFTVDNNCIHCNLCVQLCPVQNIFLDNGQISYKDKCIGCMRCYQACPQAAILLTEASKNLDKYPRYKGPVPSFDFRTMKKSKDQEH